MIKMLLISVSFVITYQSRSAGLCGDAELRAQVNSRCRTDPLNSLLAELYLFLHLRSLLQEWTNITLCLFQCQDRDKLLGCWRYVDGRLCFVQLINIVKCKEKMKTTEDAIWISPELICGPIPIKLIIFMLLQGECCQYFYPLTRQIQHMIQIVWIVLY